MGFWGRFGRRPKAGVLRTARPVDTGHLEAWAGTHRGVEGYLEPRTTVTDTTIVLVAHDGEWTRRRIDGLDGAQRLGHKLGIPVYDVAKIGYPQRMRDYTHRQKILRRRDQLLADQVRDGMPADPRPPADN